MRPEPRYVADLLRCAVKDVPSPPPPPPGLDWDTVHALLLRGGQECWLAPLIAATDSPKKLRNTIADNVRRLRRRDAYLSLALTRLLHVLQEIGCEPIVLKGAALARTVYPTREARFYSDLDLLVPRPLIGEAAQALGDLGYRPAGGPRAAIFYEKHHFHLSLVGREGINVELHWDLSRPGDYCRFDIGGFIDRSRPLDFDGVRTRIPSSTDQLLHAASQALGEGFSDLRRVVDSSLIIRAGLVDASHVAESARSQGLATALWLLLRQARSITRVGLDPSVEDSLTPKQPASVCLRSLDLTTAALDPYTGRDARSMRALTRWLCAPNLKATLGEALRFALPTDADYLDWGYDPESLPSRGRRALTALRRTASAARILAYQVRHLMTRAMLSGDRH